MGREADGVWLVNKPRGPTSFETLAQVRDRFALRKTCHGGALDPFASGLLPVLAGPAVHVFEMLHELSKTYVARVQWGTETDNGDPGGKVVATGNATALTAARLDEALSSQLGWQLQVPPQFSNKRVGNERAWRLAQRGETFELPAEREFLYAATWRSHSLPSFSELELTCRGGYYVRSLARDLGRLLGCRAHLTALERTRIGPWACPTGDEPQHLPLEAALPWVMRRTLSDDEMGRLRRKETIAIGAVEPARWTVPSGFPPVSPVVLAVHLQRPAALLDRTTDALKLHALLG